MGFGAPPPLCVVRTQGHKLYYNLPDQFLAKLDVVCRAHTGGRGGEDTGTCSVIAAVERQKNGEASSVLQHHT